MKNNLIAACLQLTSSSDIYKNLKETIDLSNKAIDKGAFLISTPEVTNIISLDRQKLKRSVFLEKDDPFLIEFTKIGIVQRHGSNNSQLPIGLSNLPNLIHLCVVFGNLSHQPFSGMSVFIFIFDSKYMYKLLLLYMINKNNNENKIK